MFGKSPKMPDSQGALSGRVEAMALDSDLHYVNQRKITSPWPQGYEMVQFGMGCFWGAERLFWQIPGVWATAVGYAGGYTPNANYAEVCSGKTGHNEVVLVVYDPDKVSFDRLLTHFWEGHDPTQFMRQGNDVGTQYRSAIYTTEAGQLQQAEKSRDAYQAQLNTAGLGGIETEIQPAAEFYYAESAHQQYLAKNPNGYCGLSGTGVRCGA